MELLLDTHALLWWFADDPQLGLSARAALHDRRNRVLVSTVTAWEIAIKFRLGKLPTAHRLLQDFGGYVSREGFEVLPLGLADALRGGSLPGPHKDPFDRMLIAQALELDLGMLTNEVEFERYGVWRIWD